MTDQATALFQTPSPWCSKFQVERHEEIDAAFADPRMKARLAETNGDRYVSIGS